MIIYYYLKIKQRDILSSIKNFTAFVSPDREKEKQGKIINCKKKRNKDNRVIFLIQKNTG